jgi:hypothetical protein
MVMVLSFGYALVGAGAAAPSTPASSAAPNAPVPPEFPSASAVHAGPATVDQVTGNFYDTNNSFVPSNLTPPPCVHTNVTYNFTFEIEYEYLITCSAGPQDPSSVSLGGNSVGVAYSDLTNDTVTATCPGAANLTDSGVFFQNSTDAGANWGSAVGIGNATCSYLQSFDPSIAIADGTIYGAFIESNASNATAPILPPFDNLSKDAIGFTTSTNNGGSFSRVVSLAAAGKDNLSDPQVAAFGHTVYIVYVNTANWTNLTLPLSSGSSIPFYPESINILYSNDGGATWAGPYLLPGENSTSGYQANSPSLAVNSRGELAVSYATNRTCIIISGACYDYGDSIVVATSTTNGTTWNAPVTVSPSAGEYACQYESPTVYQCLPGAEQGPHSSIAFDPSNPSRVYVVYTASYYTWNSSSSGEGSTSTTPNIGYGQAVFDAVSANTGATWVRSIIEEPESSFPYDFDAITNPTVTVSASGEVYVAFEWLNETTCGQFCNSAFDDYVSYWIGSSSNGGTTWNLYPALLTDVYEFEVDEDWYGLTSALTVATAGPVAVYGEGLGESGFGGFQSNLTGPIPIYYYWENYTYPTTLLAAFPSQGAPVAINFTATGLPSTDAWSFSLGGNEFSSKDATIQVTNVPRDTPLVFTAGTVAVGYWELYAGVATIGNVISFFSPGNVTVAYGIYWGVAFHLAPVIAGAFNTNGTKLSELYFDLYLDIGGVGLQYEWYTENYLGAWYNGSEGNLFPWYFPANTSVGLFTGFQSDMPISFVFGQGLGSYTGTSTNAAMTILGPINETYFPGAIGEYGISFTPVGLPSGTSYSFDFDGTSYDGTAPAAVSLSNVLTGAYSLSDVTAASSTPGDVYYAPNVGSVVNVPLQTDTLLNFTTEVDTTGTLGTATFQAVGLTTGDYWQVQFNGTTYGSSTPTISVTTHPGTFGVDALPIAASANDTTAYTATGFGPSLTVAPGSTYDVNFSLAYRVDVSTSLGGTVTGLGSHWLAPGSTASYLATPAAEFHFLGWTGAGAGSYTGTSTYANFTVHAPSEETASFVGLPANRYNLTLTETGLPANTWWTANLDGAGYSSDAATFQVSDLYSCSAGGPGQYSLAIPYVYLNGTSGVRYVATGYPSSTCTSGLSSLTIAFHAEYLVTVYSSANGNATLRASGSPASTSAWVVSGTAVSITAVANNGYVFASWLGSGSGSYSGTTLDEVITPTGPVSEVATFQLTPVTYVPVYWVSFQLSSNLVAGTSWGITFDGTSHDSVTGEINVTGLAAGSYSLSVGTTFSPDRTVEYLPHTVTSPVVLSSNRSIPIAFSTSFWFTISTSAGGTVSPVQSGYYANGSVVALVATPAVGDSFVGWVGTGAGSYTGSSPYGNVTVSGSLGETASFAPSPTSTSSTSFLASTTGIAVLAVVGLVIGLAVGLVVFRGRKPKAGAPEEPNQGGSS